MSQSAASGGNPVPSEIHFHALCSSVEHEKLEKLSAILKSHSHQLDLARTNADGFTPLELAFMTGSEEAIEALLEHGAREGGVIKDNNPNAVSAHLLSLVQEAKKQVEKFGQLRTTSSTAAQLTAAQLRECEKQQLLWQKRMNTLKRLRAGFDGAGCPHAPAEVAACVIGPSALRVRLRPPQQRSLFTKWRVQWSHSDTFARVEGEKLVTSDVNSLQCEVDGLTEGRRYFVRAAFGNPKGFGPFSASAPKSVVPSSWRSVEDRVPRIQNQLDVCVDVYADVVRAGGLDDEKALYEQHRIVAQKRKGLRHLFSSSSAPKFARTLHPNKVYLSCVIFHEDKVLMTNEESLPVMEVTDELPTKAALAAEHAWFAKMAFAWRDVERLKHEASKLNGSAHRFRASLLSAAMNMQHGLGVSDLGAAFHRPLVHSDGSAVFSLVSHLRSPKSLVSLSLKWVPLSKAQRRSSMDGSEVSAMDALRHSLREQILFSQVCEIRLTRGLYLCYLQCTSSLDSMRVVVSSTSPSVLPYIKVRDTPHVTCDEWAWVNRLGRISSQGSSMAAPSPTTNFLAGEGEEGSDFFSESGGGGSNSMSKMLKPTEAQYHFGLSLQAGLVRLFDYLEIPEEDRSQKRIYSHEILELSSEVSIVLVLPSPETVCSVEASEANRPSLNLQRNDLLTLPLQIFETIHLSTYQPDLLTAYCRAVLLLDLDLALAKQAQREAFSNQEVEAAQERLQQLTAHSQTLEDHWKPIRWLLEVIPAARNKNFHCGLRFDHLNEWFSNQTDAPDDTQFIPSPVKPRADDVDYFRRQEETLSQINASHPMREDNASSHEVGSPDALRPAAGSSSLARTPTTRSDPLEFNLSDKENAEVRNYPKMAFVPASGSAALPGSNPPSGQFGGTVVAGGAGSAPQSHVQVQHQQQAQHQAQPHPSVTYSTNSSLSSNEVLQPQPQPQPPQQPPFYENLPPEHGRPASSSSSSGRQQRKLSTSLERPIFKSYDPRVAQSGRFSNIPTAAAGGAEPASPRHQAQGPHQLLTRSLSPEPNILQVFAAYETGLASGTSVKLNVTHNTSAREVIDLVIKQLNMALILKGRDGPIYENERLKNFCLVAVIGNRERCLRDDFKPLNLQNPWKKGKLFVRMKNDLLAAIEHISRHSTML